VSTKVDAVAVYCGLQSNDKATGPELVSPGCITVDALGRWRQRVTVELEARHRFIVVYRLLCAQVRSPDEIGHALA
jgi:hypothetical protein